MTSRNRTGPQQLRLIVDTLSHRDMTILRFVSDFRLATGVQLQRFAFGCAGDSDARACRRTLERLVDDDLVRRLERRVGGVRGGSGSFLYVIGPVGERVLKHDQPRRRLRAPSSSFVDHTLAVTELFLQIVEHSRPLADAEIIGYQSEPSCWRQFSGIDGQHTLRPDLYVTLGVGEMEHRWFIEVDRATEHLPAILRKSTVYDRYYRTNLEQDRHGVFPRVLWATTTTARADQIAKHLAASNLTTRLFTVTTLGEAAAWLIGGAP
jgi:Replication-relaxation